MTWSCTAFAILLIGKTFLNTALALPKKRDATTAQQQARTIELLRPMPFIKAFANALTMPFLSQYILQVTLASGHSATLAAIGYSLYQAAFLFTLVPGGYLLDTRKPKFLLLFATTIEAILFLILGMANHLWPLLFVQLAFGLVVPFSSTAEYAYIFHFSSKENRNYAVALYLNTVRGASIAGLIVGGLLATYFPYRGIFFLSCAFGLMAASYIVLFFPKIRPKATNQQMMQSKRLTIPALKKALASIFHSRNFWLTMLLIGLPLGFLQEGVISFSLPIIFTHHHVNHALIGQFMMLFSLGFFITNKFMAKRVDRLKSEMTLLNWGLLSIALCLWLLAELGNHISWILLTLLLLGMIAGCMITPAMAYMSKYFAQQQIGHNTATSTYRLFETIGRMIGPIVIGILLATFHYHMHVFFFIGLVFIACALLRMMLCREER